MPEKQVTVIVLRADRELWDGGELRLRVKDMRAGLRLLREVRFNNASDDVSIRLVKGKVPIVILVARCADR